MRSLSANRLSWRVQADIPYLPMLPILAHTSAMSCANPTRRIWCCRFCRKQRKTASRSSLQRRWRHSSVRRLPPMRRHARTSAPKDIQPTLMQCASRQRTRNLWRLESALGLRLRKNLPTSMIPQSRKSTTKCATSR